MMLVGQIRKFCKDINETTNTEKPRIIYVAMYLNFQNYYLWIVLFRKFQKCL